MKKYILGLCLIMSCVNSVNAFFPTPPTPPGPPPIWYVTPGTDFFITSGTTVSADSLVLIPSTDFTINGNELRRKMNITHTPVDSTTINSAYLFSNVTNGFSGTIKYKYAVAALNGLTESHLKTYIFNGNNWQWYYSATNNVNSHYVVSVPLTSVALNEISLTADSVEIEFLRPRPQQPGALDAHLFEIKAYPNPTVSTFHLKVTSGSSDVIRVVVSDLNGKRVKEMKMIPNESKELGAEFLNGMYIIEFIQGNTHKSIKLEKLK